MDRQDHERISEARAEGPEGAESLHAHKRQLAQSGGVEGSGPYQCQVVCELGSIEAPEALSNIRDILVKHPSEVVVQSVENDNELAKL